MNMVEPSGKCMFFVVKYVVKKIVPGSFLQESIWKEEKGERTRSCGER